MFWEVLKCGSKFCKCLLELFYELDLFVDLEDLDNILFVFLRGIVDEK